MMPPTPLRLIPLGGLSEIGMNLMIYQYGDQMIVVDCGIAFPTSDTLGVDLIIPDVQFLVEHRHQVLAFVLTHGHEDHIGALPYIWPQIGCPIYGTDMTLGLVEHRLREHQLHTQARMVHVDYRQPVQIGPFNVCYIRVTHSIVQAAALAITTPLGTVIHTGDFNIDHTPKNGVSTDLFRLAQYGEQGVLALLSDSTNVTVTGNTRSEQVIGKCLDNVLAEATGLVVVTTFASNLHRLQTVIEAAERCGRKVAMLGRSMLTYMQIARSLGLIRLPADSVIDIKAVDYLPRAKLLLLSTGSQGENNSAMVRIANDEQANIRLQAGDTVVFSSAFIPGNETTIWSLVNMLHRKDVQVVHYYSQRDIHVSGHAPQEDLKLMLALTRPRFFIPIHGELRHLNLHRQLAHEMGIDPQHSLVATNGDCVELDGQSVRIVGHVPHGRVFVDGKGVGDVGDVVLRDRKHLSEDGIVVVVMVVEKESGRLLERPELLTRGVVYEDESQDLLEDAKLSVQEALDLGPQALDFGEDEDVGINDLAVRALRRFFKRRLGRRPVVLPLVMEM
ncbi:MAG: ribonuclease J [Magnetococcales bacterium]|nr:ribonuclease J [Magnetococcales bacterium]